MNLSVGDLIGPLEVGPVAHGGHCVARVQGRVVFVRHTLPGEVVTARVTEVAKRFARADAIDVVQASPERVAPPCPNAGVCGGCDFQHVRPEFQAELKGRVLAEQLARLAGLTWDGVVEQVPPVLGSRTRMRFVAAPDGRLGLRAHRSHEVVPLPVDGCRIAHPDLPGSVGAPPGARPVDDPAPEGEQYAGIVSAEGGRLVRLGGPAHSDPASLPDNDEQGGQQTAQPSGARRTPVVTEQVRGRTFRVRADGFWQSHVAAPEVLTAAVLDGLRPAAGERAFDLYCGVGVFAAALVDAGCEVWGIESDRTAVALARENVPQARFYAGDVARTLRRLPPRADLVVLDPPRTGAGRAVIQAVTALRPRAIAYVACDPAALARDIGVAGAAGYEPSAIRAFDLFGMTHHLEAVAILQR